jgi:hypothetical protein
MHFDVRSQVLQAYERVSGSAWKNVKRRLDDGEFVDTYLYLVHGMLRHFAYSTATRTEAEHGWMSP